MKRHTQIGSSNFLAFGSAWAQVNPKARAQKTQPCFFLGVKPDQPPQKTQRTIYRCINEKVLSNSQTNGWNLMTCYLNIRDSHVFLGS